MIDGRTLSPWEPIYTFIDKQGRNTHIHAERLRKWTLNKRIPTVELPVDRSMSKRFILENTVSKDRVKELVKRGPSTWDPVIFCAEGPVRWSRGAAHCDFAMLVDGHHRYVAASALRHPTIKSQLIEEQFWKQFLITGLRDLTQAELIARPVTRRTY